MKGYVIALDQGTTSSRAIVFNRSGEIVSIAQYDYPQIYPRPGWVEHDPEDILGTQIKALADAFEKSGVEAADIAGIGVTNQRETTIVWDKETGEPVYHAIVWQCRRTSEYCDTLKEKGLVDTFRAKTGLVIDAYFSGTKLRWILENVEGAAEKAEKGELCCGTIDSWLVYKLTGGKEFRTDYSNASRTQLFHIGSLSWDQEVCSLFGIPVSCLAEVTDSDGEYGYTDFEGYFENPIPIRGVLGDSHGALFGQGCTDKGMIKTTYGTGSSIMMNIGQKPVYSDRVVTSLAWKMNGQVNYVLEGNINYTGAVITWLKDELKLISSPSETEILANKANPGDRSYLVPAFSGLGAPYWDSEASGILTGITRTTGRAEIVRAGLESIAYQITDVVNAMSEESGIKIQELRVDGGPTRNKYLMQFQSDIADVTVQVPSAEELSGIGAAYAAGIAAGIFDREKVFSQMTRTKFSPEMEPEVRNEKYHGWKKAVKQVLT